MKNIFTDILTRADVAFIEFGRMPRADAFWDADPNEMGVISGWMADIGVWLIWVPVILACAYAYWACHGDLSALW